MTDAKPGSPLAWAEAAINGVVVTGNDAVSAATAIIEMEKALSGLLSAHVAHHNMPEHAAARATLAHVRGES